MYHLIVNTYTHQTTDKYRSFYQGEKTYQSRLIDDSDQGLRHTGYQGFRKGCVYKI